MYLTERPVSVFILYFYYRKVLARRHWEFIWSSQKPHFLSISCFSSVGNRHVGKQRLSIGTNCDHIATIEHEFLHALGFWHEQSRADRDDYVEIMWDRITEGFVTVIHPTKLQCLNTGCSSSHKVLSLYVVISSWRTCLPKYCYMSTFISQQSLTPVDKQHLWSKSYESYNNK